MKYIHDELLESQLKTIEWRYRFEMAVLIGLGVLTPLAFTAGIVVGVFYLLHK